MSSPKSILATYRAQSQTEREKGCDFEELIRTYFRNELRFADLNLSDASSGLQHPINSVQSTAVISAIT